jgi:hypothetical protein
VIAIATIAGCWTPRPYSSDPLVLHRRATVGDFEKASLTIQHIEPQPPTFQYPDIREDDSIELPTR